VEIGRQVRLLYPWAWALNGIVSTFEWLDWYNWWQLDSKTEKATSLSPGRGNLANKREKLQKNYNYCDLIVYLLLQMNSDEKL